MEKKPVPKWRMLIGIVDSAIEIIPESVFIKLINSKKKYHDKEEIKNLKRKPLLDSAIHHQWMTELKNHNKRGRPDIIHRTLLAIQDSPFISENQVDIVVETHNGILVWLIQGIRLPRNYKRFCELWAQVLTSESVSLNTIYKHVMKDVGSFQGKWLIKVESPFKTFLTLWNPSWTSILELGGEQISLNNLADKIIQQPRPAVLVGGFQNGKLAQRIYHSTEIIYQIFQRSLSTSAIVSRVLTSLEICTSLDR